MDYFFTRYGDAVDDLINLVFDYCCVRHETAGAQALYPETRPEDMICVFGGLTGEAIQYRMGLFNGKTHEGEPNGVVTDPDFEKELLGDAFRLEHVPQEDCALGLLRRLLENEDYPLDQGGDLVAYSRTYDLMQPTDEGYLPLSTEPQYHPDLPPLVANYVLRDRVSALIERCCPLEDPAEARYMLCMGALAKVMVNTQSDVPPAPALALACETMIAAAKTTPYLPANRPHRFRLLHPSIFLIPRRLLN